MQHPPRHALLFVCLGNICRSPLAKAIFVHLARERGCEHLFEVDSCGTGGWHAGQGADPRSVLVAARRGVERVHSARQYAREDAERFTHFLVMDAKNRADIVRAGAPAPRVHLIRAFDPAIAQLHGQGASTPDVPDPYYGGDDGFEKVFDMLVTANSGLLDALLQEFA